MSASKVILATLGIAVVGIGAYYIWGMNTNPSPTTSQVVPTTVTPTTTAAPTETVVPTETVTPTETPTPTPTPSTTTKKVVLTVKNSTAKYELTLELPSGTTTSASKTDLFLKDGTKTYMWFYEPSESSAKATYTSKVSVSSRTISNLKRVVTKQDLGNGFKVAYATGDMFLDNAVCSDTEFGAVASPCLTPAVKYSETVGFFAHCSAQSKYASVCDQIMKTIKARKL